MTEKLKLNIKIVLLFIYYVWTPHKQSLKLFFMSICHFQYLVMCLVHKTRKKAQNKAMKIQNRIEEAANEKKEEE